MLRRTVSANEISATHSFGCKNVNTFAIFTFCFQNELLRCWSAELAVGDVNGLTYAKSLPIGAVRIFDICSLGFKSRQLQSCRHIHIMYCTRNFFY